MMNYGNMKRNYKLSRRRKLTKENAMARKKKPLELTDWDWDTLIPVWRYYENRHTISSAGFPANMIHRFFGPNNNYSDNVRERIAYQFAYTDHGLRGEKDWDWDCGKDTSVFYECDKLPWTKFYQFCKGYLNGFKTIKFSTDGGKTINTTKAFRVDWKKRWYPVEKYLESPSMECYLLDEDIIEVS